METNSNDHSGRENFDTENTQQDPASDVAQHKGDLDDRNTKRNNFETDETPSGLDDSPLDIAEWKKNDIEESYANGEGKQCREASLDKENDNNDETDSPTRDERNLSFDRDL